MPINSLRPAWTKIRYTVGDHVHTMTLPVFPQGTPVPGSVPNVLNMGGAYVNFATAITSFVTLLKACFDSTTSFDYAEFWYQALETDDPQFITAVPLAIAGTNVGANVPAMESVITFRTPQKGGFKLYLLEAVGTVDDFQPIGSTGFPAIEALAAHVVSTANVIVARNGTFPVVGLNYITKTNDVLRDKYFIP